MPRIFWPSFDASSVKSREDYFRRLIMLFVPWRNENTLMENFDCYEEKWMNYFSNIKITNPDAYEDIQKYVSNQTKQLKMEQEIYDKRRKLGLIEEIEEVENLDKEELEVFNRKIDVDKHKESKTNMNNGQKEIFDLIINTIAEQV